MSSRRRLIPLPRAVTDGPGVELDFDVDEQDPKYAVPCPVVWCDARRHGGSVGGAGLGVLPCGAEDQPFAGLHRARVKYANNTAARIERQIRRMMRLGLSREEAKFAVGLNYLIQSAADHGSTGRSLNVAHLSLDPERKRP